MNKIYSFLLSSTKHVPVMLQNVVLYNIRKKVCNIAFVNNIHSYILRLSLLLKENFVAWFMKENSQFRRVGTTPSDTDTPFRLADPHPAQCLGRSPD